MISSSTIQLHAPDGLKANRNGEYKEVNVLLPANGGYCSCFAVLILYLLDPVHI